jgi:hypothetical protein
LRTLAAILACASLQAQTLAVDRGAALPAAGVRVGWSREPGLVADHFQIGKPGEVWIIDRIRIWALPDAPGPAGDLYEKLTLFGGIEAAPPAPGQPECDCHRLLTLKTAVLRAGAEQPAGGDVRIVQAAPGVWEVEFKRLHWSAPGGVPLQFGVAGTGRGRAWYNYASRTDSLHRLQVFDAAGRFAHRYPAEDPHLGINVQVWAHRAAK